MERDTNFSEKFKRISPSNFSIQKKISNLTYVNKLVSIELMLFMILQLKQKLAIVALMEFHSSEKKVYRFTNQITIKNRLI